MDNLQYRRCVLPTWCELIVKARDVKHSWMILKKMPELAMLQITGNYLSEQPCKGYLCCGFGYQIFLAATIHVTMRIVSRVILARFPLSIESNGAVLLQHFFLFPVLIVLIVTTRATVVLANTCNVMNVWYQFGKIWKMLKFLHNIYECCICVTHFGGGGGVVFIAKTTTKTLKYLKL